MAQTLNAKHFQLNVKNSTSFTFVLVLSGLVIWAGYLIGIELEPEKNNIVWTEFYVESSMAISEEFQDDVVVTTLPKLCNDGQLLGMLYMEDCIHPMRDFTELLNIESGRVDLNGFEEP